FVERAAAAGLQYLADATPATMFASNFGPEIERSVLAISEDGISVEQHLDVIRNRAFRQTLLCHAEVPLNRHLTAEPLLPLRFAARLKPARDVPDLAGPATEAFSTPYGIGVSAARPSDKAALYFLNSQWPRSLSFDELLAGSGELLARSG